ncbi:MAG: hypothetical protein AAFX54_16050 [Pseudomonadota bacterium]
MRSGFLSLALIIAVTACVDDTAPANGGNTEQATSAFYLGQPLPGMKPEIFAPGLVSSPDKRELNAVFSPDGREFYFARQIGEAYKTFVMHRQADGDWSTPQMASFSATNTEWDEVDMWFSPDGDALYYISNAPASGFAGGSVNIWRVSRAESGWGMPEALPAPVNSDADELYPLPTNSGAFYFASSRDGGLGGRDVYVVQEDGGKFTGVRNLGQMVNSPASDSDAYVSPDEQFMIVTAHRPEGLGGADMYYIARSEGGDWGEPVNLGAPVNSADHDYTPIVTADRCFFFFTRNGDIYWVSAQLVLKHLGESVDDACKADAWLENGNNG